MQIETTQKKLRDALTRITRIPAKNPSLPVLRCIFITAEKGVVYARATNLDLGAEVGIPAKVIQEGAVALPTPTLSAVVMSFGEGDAKVTLQLDGENMRISTQGRRTLIKALPHEDFPVLPVMPEDAVIEVPARDFAQGLRSVWYATSQSAVKPELSCVYVLPKKESILFVGTDAFRLAEKRVSLKTAVECPAFLIPFKNAQEVVRSLEGVEGSVRVGVGQAIAGFKTKDIFLTSRLVDGTYPDYEKIIPTEFSTTATLLREDVQNALKLTTVFSDSFYRVTLSVDPEKEKGALEIHTSNPDVGESDELVQAAVEGSAVSLGFNHRYLLDCFQSFSGDSVVLKFGGHGKPLVLSGVGDSSFRYLVMPMNK